MRRPTYYPLTHTQGNSLRFDFIMIKTDGGRFDWTGFVSATAVVRWGDQPSERWEDDLDLGGVEGWTRGGRPTSEPDLPTDVEVRWSLAITASDGSVDTLMHGPVVVSAKL